VKNEGVRCGASSLLLATGCWPPAGREQYGKVREYTGSE
jgi:hypothetical protein